MKWTKPKLNNYYTITSIEQLRLEKVRLYRKIRKQEDVVAESYDNAIEPFRIVKRVTNAIADFASSYWGIGLTLGFKWLKSYLENRKNKSDS